MCNFNLTFYFISFAVLWSLPFCKGATHWIVTEDGRIQQQGDSIFNLKSPFDLVTFIHQQNAFDRLKILREEYLEEKKKVMEAREKERKQMQTSFYKTDPDCVDAGKHVSEFDLHLDMTLPFTTKGINIPDHVKLCQPLPSHVEPPYCRAELPTVIYSYDHLAGVNNRHQLNTSAEPKLLTALSSYFKTREELGGHVSVALGKNSSSWVLLNLAAYYWRISGNALEAVECLRQALYFSPRAHKDRALMSLAEVLHRANHSYDSLVLLHTAIDTCSELSVYHFLLGNIYASLKIYEMAELCHRFTLVVSPDTTALCERVKAVRCELKLKELLQERHLDFDETLDSLKTPELDITKLPNSEEAEKKRVLPLETYKRQLERVFTLTQGQGTKHLEICKSRPGPPKHELRLSSDQVAAKQKPASQVMKSTHSQQDSDPQTENTSSGIQSKTLEKAILITEAIKATTHSEINSQKSSDTNGGESRASIAKERGKTSETLKVTNSPSDNSNISVQQKTMQNLQEARLALDRLKSIVKTVSEARHAESGTVDVAEEKVSKSDSGIDSKDGAKTVSAQSKASTIKSTQTFVEKQSNVKKVGDTGRMGRRGESGFKLKSDSGRREDNSKTVILEETKIAKQKGESVMISKNGPGLKLDKIASKNTREVSNAELLFQEPKVGRPTGPKHTPPLERRVKKCQNIGRKKRKGEAFAMECITQDAGAQMRSSTIDDDVPIQQAKSEFSKSTTNSEQTESDISQLQSDAEAALMKQTLADEISATALSNASASDPSLAAKVLEKSQMMTSVYDDAEERENIKRNGEKASSGSKNSDAKVVEKSEIKATVENVVKNKHSDKESELKENGAAASNGKESGNVKRNGEKASSRSKNSDAKVVERSEVKATVENVVKNKPSDKETAELKENGAAASNGKESGNVKRNGEKASSRSKNYDAKVVEKSEIKATVKDAVKNKPSGKENENKNFPVEDVVKIKASDKEGENLQQPNRATTNDDKNYNAKELEKSEMKISTVEDVKTKSSDNGNKSSKQHATTTDGDTSEQNSKGQKSTPSEPKPEQTSTDFKSSKALQSDKAAQNIKEKIKEAELLHKVGAGSNVFETSFLNVHTSGSMQELNEEECKHIEGVQALVIRNKQFSAWLSLDTKNIDVRTHIDFLSEVDDSPKKPRCTAKIKNNLHTFSGLQGVANAAKLDQVAEAGLTQTLLAIGRTMQDSVDEMGSRIFDALKKNSTSWVLLNVASLYWRVQGDTAEAIKCLRQALYFSPPKARDVAHVGLASILLREGQLDDTAVVIKKALEISPSLALGHFILGNVFGAQSKIPEAIQHYLLALQLEPGFTPAVERLKIIQCVLWKQQQALEKEASDLRKLLTPN